MFDDAPKALLNMVEQVARLIRSKGVGVYFVSQNAADVPDDILGQLGNRMQHALRVFTPKDQKSLKLAAATFRENPAFSTREAITDMGVGEALVSTLEKKGMPSIVQRTLIRPPSSQLGPITKEERAAVIANSHIAGIYEAEMDRESAFEKLRKRADDPASEAESVEREAEKAEAREKAESDLAREFQKARRCDGGPRKKNDA